jgi:hypothetical protein
MVSKHRDDLRELRRQMRATRTLITILAEPPPGWCGPPLNDDGNQAIELARTLVLPKADIQMRASVTDTYMGPAGQIRCGLRDRFEDIQICNENADLGPCIIQILGHARPGQLALGYYWNNLYQGKPDSEYYLLDGNPLGYWLLGLWELPSECEIWLLGCGVGQVSRYDNRGDGSALLYDLSHMLQRPVKAASVEVHVPTDFDNGLYTGRLLEADKLEENAEILRAELATSRDVLSLAATPPQVTFVTGIATLALRPEASRKLRIPVADLGLSFHHEVVNPDATLPLADLEVAVTFDGHTELPGEIFGNGLYLRVRPAHGHGSMRIFARGLHLFDDSNLRQRVLRHLRGLVP